MPVIGSCTDDYDDSAAWKDIDGIYKDLDQLKEKLNSLQLQANLWKEEQSPLSQKLLMAVMSFLIKEVTM